MRTSSLAVVGAVALVLGACSSAEQDIERAIDPLESDKSAGLYAGICSFSLLSYDPEYAIRFYVETSTSSEGAFTVAMTPLVGWDPKAEVPRPPATVALSQTCGTRMTASATSSSGTYALRYGALDLPALANSISGGPARIESLQFDVQRTSDERFCAGLSGKLTDPVEYELRREENTCLFLKIGEGDPLPPVAAADFHCP